MTDDDIERDDAQIITQDHSVQRKYMAEGVRRIEIKVSNFKINQEFQGSYGRNVDYQNAQND